MALASIILIFGLWEVIASLIHKVFISKVRVISFPWENCFAGKVT